MSIENSGVDVHTDDIVINENESFQPQYVCCERECISEFCQQKAVKIQKVFKSKKGISQQQFLIDSSLMFLPLSSSRSTINLTMMLEGKKICRNAFLKILGVSLRRFKAVTTNFHQGIHRAYRKCHVRAEMARSSEAKTWILWPNWRENAQQRPNSSSSLSYEK